MALIYLVQSASDLTGSAGYSNGLLEGEHHRLLVTFADLTGKRPTIFRSESEPKRRKLKPSKVKK